MATPQLNGRIKVRERPTYGDMLWEQKATRLELNARIDKLADKINAPDGEKIFSSWHVSAADMSTLAIGFGVIYALIFK